MAALTTLTALVNPANEDLAMKSSRYGVCLTCLVVILLAAVGSAAGDDTTLRWKFTTGQKRSFVVNQSTVIKMDFSGNETVTKYTQTTEVSWDVKSVDKDGTADVLQTIDRIRFQVTSPPPGGNVDFDTANKEDAPGTLPVSKLFRSIAGSQFKMKITPRGEVRDFTIPTKLVETIKSAGRDARMLGNEESIRNPCSQSLVIFPEAAVGPGGKAWTGSRKMPMPFGMIAWDATYTPEGATGPVANIGLDAKMTKLEPTHGFEIKPKSQQMKGHYRFDNSAGVLKFSEVVQKMSMTLTAGGHQLPTELELSVKLELKGDGLAR